MKPILSYRLLESKPVDDSTERVRVAVTCTPSCSGFTGVTMQFDVPAAVTLAAGEGQKKGKKKGSTDAEPVIISDARDLAIRTRVAWKANQETHLGHDAAMRFTEAAVVVEA